MPDEHGMVPNIQRWDAGLRVPALSTYLKVNSSLSAMTKTYFELESLSLHSERTYIDLFCQFCARQFAYKHTTLITARANNFFVSFFVAPRFVLVTALFSVDRDFELSTGVTFPPLIGNRINRKS
jgi:hypothetical protein